MKKFRSLEKSQKFVKSIYPILARIENPFRDQLKRSSLSIALNLAEGFAKTGAERKRFYRIAYGSAKETKCCMEILGLELTDIDQLCAMTYKLEKNAM